MIHGTISASQNVPNRIVGRFSPISPSGSKLVYLTNQKKIAWQAPLDQSDFLSEKDEALSW
jgi:hypothetical protein